MKGTMRFDSLALGELTISFIAPGTVMTGKAAFVDSKTGTTHGWTETSGGWSETALKALAALKEAVEADFGKLHLETTHAGTVSEAPQRSSLSVHLGSPATGPNEAPSA